LHVAGIVGGAQIDSQAQQELTTDHLIAVHVADVFEFRHH
jgi:hypothetical protein